MSFSKLGLSPPLIKSLTLGHYDQPYPVQKQLIPHALLGKDILGIAPTGTGKTASYVLPILMHTQKKPERAKNKMRHIPFLVMVPTRELANQVREVFHTLGAFLPIPVKSMAVFGGVSIQPQMKGLYATDILIATPGRLLELIDSNAIHLDAVHTFVLDEADKLLHLGFEEEMGRIFTKLPKKRQNLLFSATLNADVSRIHQFILDQPEVIDIKQNEDENNLDLIDQIGYFVAEEKKGPLLRQLILDQEMHQVLIFVSSVFKADHLVKKLKKNDIDAAAIHSKKSQGSRTDVLVKFKNNKLRVLVATDILARGIDIAFLPYVINYELPRSPKDFIHRIGRTGRSQNPGKVITFITPEDTHHFKVIQKKMRKNVDMIDSASL